MTKTHYTKWIKEATRALGFDYCGIARAEPLDEDARRLERWLNKGMHGSMQYMADHFDLRVDPCKLVPGARSVITLLLNYFPGREALPESSGISSPRIAKYAYGKDYHEVIRGKLNLLLQQMRASYTWVSTWPPSTLLHYLICFGIVLLALGRLSEASFELRVFLIGLPMLGLLSMPASWFLLERMGWSILPQYQPMRTLLFVMLAMQFAASAAGVRATARQRPAEAAIWFALAYLVPMQSQWTQPLAPQKLALVLVLAGGTALARQYAPAVALAAFFAIPTLGGVQNYPHLHTPALKQLSGWARSATPRDSVFLFPDAGRSLYPGIFRADALRAVYVDWKGGGQVNFAKQFGEEWWFRWQQTAAVKFKPSDLSKYPALGIQYVVLQSKNRVPLTPVFENSEYVAYRLD